MAQKKLASEVAYEELRNAIISLDLKPGEILREHELQEEFEVGRTPLRDAIRRLANEGLITVIPRQGTYVSEVKLSEVQDVLELREHLEPFAAELAAQRRSQKDIDLLEKALQMHEERKRYSFEIDLELHSLVAEASKNAHIAETLTLLHLHSVRMFRLAGSSRQSLQDILREHREIVEAIEESDAEAAQKASLHHVLEAKSRLLSAL